MSAMLLDRHVFWSGGKASDIQPMEWPRIGIHGLSSEIVPKAVQVAQMELALILLTTDTTALPSTAGLKTIQADTIKIEVNPGDRSKVIPDSVFALVAAYGSRSGGLGTVTMRR
jgi:hypothetical protein